jgi:hypothetical protein
VPEYVPNSVIVTVPSTSVYSIAASSFVFAPTVIVVPTSWSSPVAIPASYAWSISSAIISASSPSVAIVSLASVPFSVPYGLIVSLPSSAVFFAPSGSI